MERGPWLRWHVGHVPMYCVVEYGAAETRVRYCGVGGVRRSSTEASSVLEIVESDADL